MNFKKGVFTLTIKEAEQFVKNKKIVKELKKLKPTTIIGSGSYRRGDDDESEWKPWNVNWKVIELWQIKNLLKIRVEK